MTDLGAVEVSLGVLWIACVAYTSMRGGRHALLMIQHRRPELPSGGRFCVADFTDQTRFTVVGLRHRRGAINWYRLALAVSFLGGLLTSLPAPPGPDRDFAVALFSVLLIGAMLSGRWVPREPKPKQPGEPTP